MYSSSYNANLLLSALVVMIPCYVQLQVANFLVSTAGLLILCYKLAIHEFLEDILGLCCSHNILSGVLTIFNIFSAGLDGHFSRTDIGP